MSLLGAAEEQRLTLQTLAKSAPASLLGNTARSSVEGTGRQKEL